LIEQSQVYKCLEKKTLILGFELPDLFALSLLLCVLNFIFATSDLKFFFTFGPVALLGILLRIMKNGKADNYLLHWLRYHISPGIYRAFPLAGRNEFLKIKQKGGRHARFCLEPEA
jgi:hypothetical protein